MQHPTHLQCPFSLLHVGLCLHFFCIYAENIHCFCINMLIISYIQNQTEKGLQRVQRMGEVERVPRSMRGNEWNAAHRLASARI